MPSKKGTWKQAIISVALPVLAVLGFRWLLFEPFVIPSGSMIPSLLIHDHILVNKIQIGIRVPFTNFFLAQWNQIRRGDVVVFKFPENPDVYYVKRLIGLPGDRVSMDEGTVYINDKPLVVTGGSQEQDSPQIFEEQGHLVQYYDRGSAGFSEITVPEGEFFFLGDNRDQSNDSRFWGTVKSNLIVGKAQWIWLSCEDTFTSAEFLCKPETIRWERLFRGVR